MRDYRRYYFSKKEYVLFAIQALGIVSLVSYLFYHSLLAMVLVIPFYPVFLRMKAQVLLQKQKSMLQEQFKEAICALATALGAGYSIENAWKEARKEVEKLFGEHALIVQELNHMLAHLEMNVSLEELLSDFALRSGLEDVGSFCQVFLFAKRSGGDFIGIIHATANRISRKVDLQREIITDLAARRLESRVMNMVPMFMLLYLNLTSPGYFDLLYGNLSGVIIMSLCLLFYLLAYVWSERMLQNITNVW
ncbi:MAG: type II secretion system F family protein [Lachnospiraceae bacterium]|nr:type II secretion system F family protein [Lachnospiraceae bacterium]